MKTDYALNFKQPIFAVVTGPSGVGKTTIIQGVMSRFTYGLQYAISCTTRKPRGSEKNGKEYHFITPARFQGLVEAGSFIEHATVYGNRYGTLREEITHRLERGISVITDVDVQGAESILRCENLLIRRSLLGFFVSPPTVADLARRLNERKTEDSEQMSKRLAEAKREMKKCEMFGHPPVISVYGQIDLAVDRICDEMMAFQRREV